MSLSLFSLPRVLAFIRTLYAILIVGLYPLIWRRGRPGRVTQLAEEYGYAAVYVLSTIMVYYASYCPDCYSPMAISLLLSLMARDHLGWNMAIFLYACNACYASYKLGHYSRSLVSARTYHDNTKKEMDRLFKLQAEVREETEKTKSTQKEALAARDEAISDLHDSSTMQKVAIGNYHRVIATQARIDEIKAQKERVLGHLLEVKEDIEQRKAVADGCSKPIFQFGHNQKAQEISKINKSLVEDLDQDLRLIEQAFAEARACTESFGTAEGLAQDLPEELDESKIQGDKFRRLERRTETKCREDLKQKMKRSKANDIIELD